MCLRKWVPSIGRISNYRKEDLPLFLADEVPDFIDKALDNLSKMKPDKFNVIKTSLLMFYEAKYFLFYDGLDKILMMNCFEFLLGGICRIDKNKKINDNVFIEESYKNICNKFQYQSFIDNKLKKEISGNIKDFKKNKGIGSIASFSSHFSFMRNWIGHGKHGKRPTFGNSPSNNDFSFEMRLENFIRIIFIDLIYGKDYKRKFDFLYQSVMEQNICMTPIPEFPKLKFCGIDDYKNYLKK